MSEENVWIVSNSKGIMFSKSGHVDIVGHTDSDFTDRKFASGICYLLEEIFWLEKKQNVMSLFSVESKVVNRESQKSMVCSNCTTL